MLAHSRCWAAPLADAEGQAGGPLVALLSEGLWRQSFHADPGIVGQSVKSAGKPYAVIGVMPQSFQFPGRIRVRSA